jgi:hypothetical protein
METELAIENLPHAAEEAKDTAPEPMIVAPAPNEVIVDQAGPASIGDPPTATADRGEVIQLSPESATPPSFEPEIELAAEPMEGKPEAMPPGLA